MAFIMYGYMLMYVAMHNMPVCEYINLSMPEYVCVPMC